MNWLEYLWYRVTPLHIILFPISVLFRLLISIRYFLYQNQILPSQKLAVPVIVIGNISVGGTGKTPVTLELAKLLIIHGWHPMIVSRGYGGTTQQPQQVSAQDDPKQVGDEPLLMAQRALCPVWIGRNRAQTAQQALTANPKCNVILCDDGLQHYRLARTFEIAITDQRSYGNGWLLPAGPLREPISRLRTVDAVIVNSNHPESGQFQMQLKGSIFYQLNNPKITAEPTQFKHTKNHAVAGIGHPDKYFLHLRQLGVEFTPHAFPDHHPYKKNELIFNNCDVVLLTEKDAVKCASFADDTYWVLRVDAHLEPALVDQILRKIS